MSSTSVVPARHVAQAVGVVWSLFSLFDYTALANYFESDCRRTRFVASAGCVSEGINKATQVFIVATVIAAVCLVAAWLADRQA
jgi:hypothetical protein